MAELFAWLTATPLGIVTIIGILMVGALLFAAFYELRTRRLFPNKKSAKSKKKRR